MTKPEGAEMRFSQHVVEEIRAGRFIEDRFSGFMDSPREFTSPDAYLYRYDDTGDYSAEQYDKKCFALSAWRTGWPWNRRNAVKLSRGRRNITELLSQEEVDSLAAAWVWACDTWDAKEAESQRAEEAKRQRAAWWP